MTFKGNTIFSSLSNSKIQTVYSCEKCGFDGIFSSSVCARCGQPLYVIKKLDIKNQDEVRNSQTNH